MKILLGTILALALTGCGQFDRNMARWTGDPTAICYKGVEYVQFTSGASIAYNQDGTVRTCNEQI